MFKRRRQHPFPGGTDSSEDGDRTFLDGIFGDRSHEPSREPVQPSGAGRPGALPRRRPSGPAGSPTPAAPPAPAEPAAVPVPVPVPSLAPSGRAPDEVPVTATPRRTERPRSPDRPHVVPGKRPRRERDGRRRGADLLLLLLACLVIGLAVAVLTGVLGPLRHSPTSSTKGTASSRASRPSPPSALPPTGSYQRTSIGPRGVVRVTQWIRSDTPLKSIKVTPVSGSPSATARATDLVVTTGRSRVRTPATVGPKGRRIRLSPPAKLVSLTYHLTGVLDRASSVRGRVLVRATAMRVAYRHRTGPAVVRVEAPSITSVACTDAPLRGSAAGQPLSTTYVCGSPSSSPSVWTVKLTRQHRGASVSAQVELR